MPPPDRPAVRTVSSAYLTAVTRGDLRHLTGPRHWIRGAAYDDGGRLVPESQRVAAGGQWIAADPRSVRRRPAAERLPGRWLYGGTWMGQFGHFLTETVTTLWPRVEPVAGLVFHSFSEVHLHRHGWQQRLVDLTGYAGFPAHVVHDAPVVVDELVVPERSLALNAWATPEAVAVWDRMAAAAPAGAALGDRVFLSRTRFHAAAGDHRRRALRGDPELDRSLDALFASAGFTVVHPEELPVPRQVAVVAGAQVLAASAGSALHLSAFLPDGGRVVDVGDARTPYQQVPLQRVIDAARHHRVAHLDHTGEPLPLDTLARLGL